MNIFGIHVQTNHRCDINSYLFYILEDLHLSAFEIRIFCEINYYYTYL